MGSMSNKGSNRVIESVKGTEMRKRINDKNNKVSKGVMNCIRDQLPRKV